MSKIKTKKQIYKKISKVKRRTIKNCCSIKSKRAKKCIRKSDGKIFSLPRRFPKTTCKNKKHIKGFTMRSSCAPYKDC